MFPSSTNREIRHFYVVVVQWLQRNVQKSVMHVQSWCFANLNLLFFCRSRWRRRDSCLSSLCFLSNTRSFSLVFWTQWDVKTGIVICMLAALIKLVALVASTAKDLSVIIAWSFQKIPNKSMSTGPTASMVKTRAGVQRQPIDRLYALQSSKTFIRNDYCLLRLGFEGLCLFFLSLHFLLYSHSIRLFCQVSSFWYHAQSPL